MIAPMTTSTNRPLSPHLQIYNLPMTARMSITHRMTGVILQGGMVFLAGFLVAAAMGEEHYNLVMQWAAHPIGQIVLFGWAAAFYYHLCNGIRHLVWDTGRLFNVAQANLAGWIILLATAALTAGTWYMTRGGQL